ncbi:MAG TPA: 4'-phosphopantetheinyl transferase superfamily protein [Solirubrobacterales bacterium]|jgi:4'-phosphopantetheinyl transferase
MRVWQANLRRSDEWIDGAIGSVLGEDEARRGRESHQVWRRRVVARAGLRTALGQYLDCSPGSLAFALGPGGKPRLAGPAGHDDVFFNLARSGDLCLIAISADGPIGVDVEEIRDVPELESLVRSRFAASEAAAILERSGEERLSAFYRCWTRKEACVKAIGTEIGPGLDSVVVSVGDRPALLSAPGASAGEWSLLDLALGDGFIGALAVWGAAEGDLGPPAPLDF